MSLLQERWLEMQEGRNEREEALTAKAMAVPMPALLVPVPPWSETQLTTGSPMKVVE